MIAFAIILAAVAVIAVAEGITVVAFMAAASCAEQAEELRAVAGGDAA